MKTSAPLGISDTPPHEDEVDSLSTSRRGPARRMFVGIRANRLHHMSELGPLWGLLRASDS
jgi:hypothetical protein